MSKDGSKVAVLLINNGDSTATLKLNFADIPYITECHSGKFAVRDIWAHTNLGLMVDANPIVHSHDAAFWMVSCHINTTEVEYF